MAELGQPGGSRARNLWGLPDDARPLDAADLADDDAVLDRLAAVLPALTDDLDVVDDLDVFTDDAPAVAAARPPAASPFTAPARPAPGGIRARPRSLAGPRLLRAVLAVAAVYLLVTAGSLIAIRLMSSGSPPVVVGPPACPWYWAPASSDRADASRAGCFFVG